LVKISHIPRDRRPIVLGDRSMTSRKLTSGLDLW